MSESEYLRDGSAAAGLTRREVLKRSAVGAGVLLGGGALAGITRPAFAQPLRTRKIGGHLNVITWDGYDNPDVVRGFEEKYGVRLNIKIGGGNPEQVAAVRASNITWDVANPDNDYVQRLAKARLIQPLSAGDYPHLHEMYKTFRNFPPHHYNGKLYGLPIRFGINGIVHWPDKLSVKEAQNAWSLWDASLKGRIDAADWYDLNILLVALYLGDRKPWLAHGAELKRVEKKLLALKPNIRSLSANIGDIKTDMANKDAWVVWGASSSDTAIGLRESGKNVSLTIPKQGGAVWTEALVITKKTQNLEAAKAYLNYMTSPEVQAKMAWNRQFKIAVCNAKAQKYLSAKQVKILNLDKANEWLSRPGIVLSQSPAANQAWTKLWEKFKAS